MLRRDATLSNALDDLASPAPRHSSDVENPVARHRGSSSSSSSRGSRGGGDGGLSESEVLEREEAAAVAGMARSRAVYFNNSLLDGLFWLRNQHPILGCFAAHPLHPFRRKYRLQLLSIAVLFAVFTSVVTLLECAAATVANTDAAGGGGGPASTATTDTQVMGPAHQAAADNNLVTSGDNVALGTSDKLCPAEQLLAECGPYQSCYRFRIMGWGVVGALLQVLLEVMAVCACIQPGGGFFRCCSSVSAVCIAYHQGLHHIFPCLLSVSVWGAGGGLLAHSDTHLLPAPLADCKSQRMCCGAACMEKGQQAIILCQMGAMILLIAATVLAEANGLEFGAIVVATLRTKLFSAGVLCFHAIPPFTS